MIIWSYLMTILWLFVIMWCLFDHNYSWLFDDCSISAPAAGCLVCFISKSLRMEQWIIMIWVMAAFHLGILQPASLACNPVTCCRSYASSATTILSFMAVLTSLAPCPTPPQHPSARGSGHSHHAKSDGILHPDHKSFLWWSCEYSPMRSQWCNYRL